MFSLMHSLEEEIMHNYDINIEKFGELIRTKEAVQEKNDGWNCIMRGFCKQEYAKERKEAMEQIEEAQAPTIKGIEDDSVEIQV